MFKKVMWGLVALGGLGVLAVVLTWAFFPKARVLRYAQEQASSAVGAPITLGDVGLSFSPLGVRLLKFEMGAGSQPGKPEVKLDELRVGLRILPLLKSRVEITEIYLKKPIITLIQAPQSPQEAAPPPSEAPADLKAIEGHQFVLEQLVIEDGEVHVFDPNKRPLIDLAGISERLSASLEGAKTVKLKGTLKIASLAYHLPAGTLGQGLDLNFDKALTYDLQAKEAVIDQADLHLGDLTLGVTGRVSHQNADNPSFDVAVQGGPSQIQNIVGYLPAQIFPQVKGLSSKGTITLSAVAKGTVKQPDYRVAFTLKDGELRYPKLPAPVSGINIDVTATPSRLEIAQLEAVAAKSRVRVLGSIDGLQREPQFTLSALVTTDLEELSKLHEGLDAKVAGLVDLNAQISGTQKAPQVTGRVKLSDLAYQDNAQKLPALKEGRGTLELGAKDASVKGLAARFGKSDIAIDGSLTGLVPFIQEKDAAKKRLGFNVAIKSQYLDLDELMALAGDKEEEKKSEGVDVSLLDPFTGTFSFEAKEAIYNKLRVNNVVARAELKRGIFELKQVAVGVFGGGVTIAGLADYRNIRSPLFDVQLGLKNLESREVLSYASGLNRFGQLAGYLSGRFTTNMSLKGRLKEDMSLDLASLMSKGDVSMANATFSGHPVQNALAGYLEASSLKSVQVKQWFQPFEIKEGALNISKMKLSAQDFDMSIDGKQSLDGSSQFALNLTLPQSLSQGIKKQLPSQVSAILFDGSAKLRVPMSLTGTLQAPKFNLLTDQLVAQAQARGQAKLQAEASKLADKAKADATAKAESALKQKLGTSDVSKKKQEVQKKATEDTKKAVEGETKKLLKKLF